jgi:shikimate 5-dehydrogenase
MTTWVEIGFGTSEVRYNFLSKVLTEKGVANEVQYKKTDEKTFVDDLNEVMLSHKMIRIGRGLSELVVPHFPVRTEAVQRLRVADTLTLLDGTWVLDLVGLKGVHRAMMAQSASIDYTSVALVVGSGISARMAIAALFKLGFKEFVVSAPDERKVKKMTDEFSRTHLGIKFKAIPKDGLILLPGVHGVLVNTTPMRDDNPMLVELSYFNFFKPGGVAVDFSLVPIETGLIKSASEIGASLVYGYEIAGFTDLAWVEQFFKIQVEPAPFIAGLKEALLAAEKNPRDEKV